MKHWWLIYLLTALVAAAASVLFTWLARRFAPCLGFLDLPLHEAHKKHRQAMPVLGGVAMFLAWLLVIVGGLVLSSAFQELLSPEVAYTLPGIQTVLPQLLYILFGAAALVLLGVLDDRLHLDALTKLCGQFCICGAVACWGVRITLFWNVPAVTWLITTFWLLLLVNAMNFFDNMDGLAAGFGLIAAAMFLFVAGLREQHFVAVLAAATAGTAAGFFWFNRHPATIFMGDAGSHFLGFALAVIGALTTFYTPSESPTPAPVLIPLLILALPIFDLLAVVVIRLREKRPIYIGDRRHISHRFELMGLTRSQAVAAVHLLALGVGAGALTLLWLPTIGTFVVFSQAAVMLTLVSMLHTRNLWKVNVES